jgi:hypothetical protein
MAMAQEASNKASLVGTGSSNNVQNLMGHAGGMGGMLSQTGVLDLNS